MKKFLTAALLACVLAAAPAAAQDMTSSLMDRFERQRANVLGMVDAMPESGLRTAPTEGVRDFAQQIEHVVAGNVNIIRSGVDRPVQIEGHDPEVYLNSKDALKAFVNAGFDAVHQMVMAQTAATLQEETQLFGQATVQRWELIQAAFEHGVWTLGATVPYVRLQGGTPGGYNLIPGTGM